MTARIAASASLFFMLGLCGIGRAEAHASPVSYEPEPSVSLQQPPAEIRIRFSERAEPRASGIAVIQANGEELALDANVSAEDPRVLTAAFPFAATGSYVVSWRVISADDGHFTKGSFAFGIGNDTAIDAGGSNFSVTHRSGIAEGSLVATELLGSSIVLAGLVLPLLLGGALRKRRVHALLLAGSILTVIGASGAALYQAFSFSAESGMGFEEALSITLATAAGKGAAIRAVLGLILGIVIQAGRSKGRGWLAAALVLTVLHAILRASVSHAAASEFLPVLGIAMNAVHLLAKSLWIGGAIVFFAAGTHTQDVRSSVRFSKILAWCLLIGGLTGTYIVWLHLKAFENVVLTHWGMHFFALATFGALLLSSRLYLQLIIEPAAARLERGKGTEEDASTVAAGWITSLFEALTGVAVIFFSSLLIITTPPLPFAEQLHESSVSGDASVTLSTYRYSPRDLLLTFKDAAGGADIGKLTILLTNTERDIGPLEASSEKIFEGGYLIPLSQLTPQGRWIVEITGSRENAYDVVGRFEVRVPQDTVAPAEQMHRWGTFETGLILIAAGVVLLFFFLRRFADRLLRNLGTGKPRKTGSGFAKRHLAAALGFEIMLLGFMAYASEGHHGGFQTRCVNDGNAWHESVPMRFGKVLSDRVALGCMIGSGKGQSHIADMREYLYFTRPVSAQAALATLPANPASGVKTMLTFTLRDGDGKPLSEMALEHDRIAHIIVIGQDLQTFAHLHPEDAGAVSPQALAASTFSVPFTFPKAGRYAVTIDFTVRAHTFSQTFYVNVAGKDALPLGEPSEMLRDTSDGYNVSLTPPGTIRTGVFQQYSFHIEKNGPVTDLQPYLAAPMHLAIISGDLRHVTHTHASLPATLWQRLITPAAARPSLLHTSLTPSFGPDLETYLRFDAPGTYVIFAQYKHLGAVRTARFVLEVES